MANLTDFPIEGTSALFSSGGDGDLNYTGELVDSGVNLTDSDGNVLAGTGKFIGDLSGSATTAERLTLATAGYVKTDANGVLSVVQGNLITLTHHIYSNYITSDGAADFVPWFSQSETVTANEQSTIIMPTDTYIRHLKFSVDTLYTIADYNSSGISAVEITIFKWSHPTPDPSSTTDRTELMTIDTPVLIPGIVYTFDTSGIPIISEDERIGVKVDLGTTTSTRVSAILSLETNLSVGTNNATGQSFNQTGTIITDIERSKLGDIEENADVTSDTNGAVMKTGAQTIDGEKTFTSPTNTTQLNLTGDGGIGTNVDDDVLIYRNNVDKITFGDDETIIEDNTLFNSYVSVGGGTHSSRYAAPLTIRAAEYGTLTGGTMRYRWITSSNDSGMDGVLKSYGTLENPDIEISIWAIHSIVTRDKLMAHGSMLTASDDRIKSEETPIENATEALLKLTPKNYFKHASYRVDADDESPIPEKDSSGNSIYKSWESGLISQDVLKVDELQHIVEHMPDTEGEGDTISLKYTELIPWLIKSIQELNQRIIELEQK